MQPFCPFSEKFLKSSIISFLPDVLQEGKFKVISLQDCQRMYRNVRVSITIAKICTNQRDRAFCSVSINIFVRKLGNIRYDFL